MLRTGKERNPQVATLQTLRDCQGREKPCLVVETGHQCFTNPWRNRDELEHWEFKQAIHYWYNLVLQLVLYHLGAICPHVHRDGIRGRHQEPAGTKTQTRVLR